MSEKDKTKKSPAQRLGEEAAKAYSGPVGSGRIRVDNLGSYTGLGIVNKPLRMLDDVEFASPRLSPEFLGGEPVEAHRLIEEPVQDADDL